MSGGKGEDGVVGIANTLGGYNGGGNGKWDGNDNESTGGGGGATHISTQSGLLSSLSSNRDSILIVSGSRRTVELTHLMVVMAEDILEM